MTPAATVQLGRALLVGEDNPYGDDPRAALYPYPPNSAGARLREKVLGVSLRTYLRRFERVNLCRRAWSMPEAREAALAIIMEADDRPRAAVILLGAKVARAFGHDYTPFTRLPYWGHPRSRRGDTPYVILPHPSGRCRAWNEAGAYDRARRLLIDVLPQGTEGKEENGEPEVG